MTRVDAKGFLQLLLVFVPLFCSLGHTHTVYYQYAVRFLYEEDCKKCLEPCALSIQQCANLEFHYFNVTVLKTVPNCSAREMLLLLELQQMDRKNRDSVYLVACVDGMNGYHFWNYLACSTLTKGGGRDKDLINCKPNEILSPDGSSNTGNVVSTGFYVVLALLVVAIVSVLLLLVVVTYQCCCNRTRNDPGRVPQPYQPIDPSPALSCVARLKQWAIDRRLVGPRWNTPTARPPPATVVYDSERPRPRGASQLSEEHPEAHVQGGATINTLT